MDTGSDARQTARTTAPKGGRLRSITMLVIFDIGGPLAAYNGLRSAGMTAVTALLLSGVFPALGVTIGAVRRRRLDVVGTLVLAGIVVGTILGLVSHSARLLLVDGSVPTAVFGVACLGSLRARHPLMFSFAREFTGPDTARGREMTRLWQYEGFRRVFRVITAVWGVAFLLEAALRVVIVYNTSAGTALAISRVMPFVFAAIMSAWTVAYGKHHKKKGERMAAVGLVRETKDLQVRELPPARAFARVVAAAPEAPRMAVANRAFLWRVVRFSWAVGGTRCPSEPSNGHVRVRGGRAPGGTRPGPAPEASRRRGGGRGGRRCRDGVRARRGRAQFRRPGRSRRD